MQDEPTAELDHLLDLIAAETSSLEASVVLAGTVRESPTPSGTALLWAFQQLLRLSEGNKTVSPFWIDRYGDGPSRMPTEHRDALIAAAASDHASVLVRAHLGHLVWSTSPGGDVLAISDAGVDAFLELSQDHTTVPYDRYCLLVAAVDLASRRRDDTRKQLGLRAFLQLVDEVLALGPEDEQPGTVMLTIGHFLLLGGDRDDAQSRLEAAIDVFASHSHARQDIAGMLAGLAATPEEGAGIADAEITRLLADAESQPGFLKENTLRRAMSLARSSGLRERAGEVSVQLAAITPDDYDLKSFTHTYTLSGDEIRGMLAAYQPGQPIRTGFLTLGSRFPRFLPADERGEFPISVMEQIATPSLISGHGHTEHVASSEAQRLTYRYRREDMMEFQIQYPFILDGLRLMLDQSDGLAEFRSAIDGSPVLSDKGKRRAHKALDAYLAEDWDAVSDTLPTIESAIRMLCVSSGINIYAPAGDANEFKALGGLFVDLANSQDDQARRFAEYWRFSLTDRLGLNIRNDYLHGLQEDATQMTATVIMHIYSQLVFFISKPEPEPGDVA